MKMRGGKNNWIMRIAGGREKYEGDGMRGMRNESEGKPLEVGVGAQGKKKRGNGGGWGGDGTDERDWRRIFYHDPV